MKKNIGFVPMDSSLAAWLLEKLTKEPPVSDSTEELRSGIQDIFMYFVFCPLFISGGVLFNDLSAHYSGAELAVVQAQYIGMFQAGWFVESMWSQTLVIHMIRTPKIPFIQSHASAPVTLLTMTGIAVLTVIPFTPFGAALGFVALPAAYFAYLIPCILLYMVLATSLKKAYVRHYGELL